MKLFCLVSLFALFGPVIAVGKHREKRLADIVCDEPGTTKIKSPHYYRDNAQDFCGIAVAILDNDFFNMDYRRECQRWIGGNLPDKVAGAQLRYCYEYDNGTATYDMGICCMGTVSGARCFTGSLNLPWSSSESYYSGHINYQFNFENDLQTCAADEVCQTSYTFYGSDGNIDTFTMSKGCAKSADCQAIRTAGTCDDCVVQTPQCASCCQTPFCNFDFQNYQSYQVRPTTCPTEPPPPPCWYGPCANDAVCENTPNGDLEFTCYCQIAWKGLYCNESRSECLIANPCLNNGTCYDYSDMAPGDYRCDCQEPFVGDNCEIPSNLTCHAPDIVYTPTGISVTVGNCTPMVWSSLGHPEISYSPAWNSFVSIMCKVDGHEAAFKIVYEMKTCRRGDRYSWVSYHSCCLNRTTCSTINPCLNGGTCYDWSDIGVGEYRCDCAPGFTGDNCEIASILTCNTTDVVYGVIAGRNYYPDASWNCTQRALFYSNKPYDYDHAYWTCSYTMSQRRPDGHMFVQGIDGQIKRGRILYEMGYCGRMDVYSWAKFDMCCPSCLSSPCQNGGYCQQIKYDLYRCRCPFGYGGDNCEIKLAYCLVNGEPHYRTFDALKYNYQGVLKYNLASVCSNDTSLQTFQVLARNEYRFGQTAVSYLSYIEIVDSSGQTVRLPTPGLDQNGLPTAVLVNGYPVQIPYQSKDFVVYQSMNFITYTSFTSRLQISFDPSSALPVTLVFVPEYYADAMCGLCGNFDNNKLNDFKLPNGTVLEYTTANADVFGNSYLVYDPQVRKKRAAHSSLTTPASVSADAPCVPTADQITKCSIINNPNGVFSRCIPKLKPGLADAYYNDCLMDACYSDGLSICKSIRIVVTECLGAGSQVPCSAWLTGSGCGSEDLCPDGMTYKCQVTACQPTCADPTAPDSCPLAFTDGCVCPTGQFLYNGTCLVECPPACMGPNQQLIPVGTSLSAPGCITVNCLECENCTDGVEMETIEGCLQGQRCVNDMCTAVSLPPGLEDNTHAQPCAPHCGEGGNDKTSTKSHGGGNGNADPPATPPGNGNGHTDPPVTPPGQVDKTHEPECAAAGNCGNTKVSTTTTTKKPPPAAANPPKKNPPKKSAKKSNKAKGRKGKGKKG